MTGLPGIGAFTPQDAQDQTNWRRLEDFLAAKGDLAFSRDPYIGGHVTGSAILLSPDRSALLLTHHRKLGLWLQLGGHCDGVCDARATALKEAREESGIAAISPVGDTVLDIDIHTIPASRAEPAHLHYDIRYLFQAHSMDFAVSPESCSLAWVTWDNLETYTKNTSVLRLREKFRALLGFF